MKHNPSDFYFNPFAGISHEDIDEVIVAKPEVEKLINEIGIDKPLRVEFLGKKGRGKTTHLAWLHTHFSEYPMYLLNNGADKRALLKDSSPVLFIDSIHRLSLSERIKLFRVKKSLIFTTHWSRKWEAGLAGKSLHTIRFSGIAPQILTEIIQKRFQYAAKELITPKFDLEHEEMTYWIEKHGDNYRAILNELYCKYQYHEHTF